MTTQSNDNDRIPKTWRSELASLNPLAKIVTVSDLMYFSHHQFLSGFFLAMKKNDFKDMKWCLETRFKLSPDSIQHLCEKASNKHNPGRYIMNEIASNNEKIASLPLETFKQKFLNGNLSVELWDDVLETLARCKYSEQKKNEIEEESSED